MRFKVFALSVAPFLLMGSVLAQNPPGQTTPGTSSSAPTESDPPHKGQIVIQSHGESPSASSPASKSAAPEGERLAGEDAKADVSDAEREALRVTSYDLDARLNLQRSSLSMRARIAVRNNGREPLRQIPLQISSSLHWESATLVGKQSRTALTLAQHRLDTDTDHTGAASEAVLSLPEPLAPGASLSLDLFYSGTLAESGGRLARLGASAGQQREADWDAIGSTWTGLRGFGNVLWYPVSSPQLFLADGNTLFTAISHLRQQDQDASMQLHLSAEYAGEPPVAAYFCGRRAAFKATADDPNAPTATGAGIASTEFASQPLGFRLPSLFIIEQPEVMLGGGAVEAGQDRTQTTEGSSSSASSSASSSEAVSAPSVAVPQAVSNPVELVTEEPVLALISSDPGTAAGLGAAADRAASLLADWMGPRPLSALTLIDHSGQPFQDGPLLVAPAATLQTSPEMPALVYSMSHGWVQTGQPWMDEGLAQFFSLLWVERESGRAAALSQLQDLMQPVALAEPELTPDNSDNKAGQSLISSPDELFYRRKAAAVWWMLRDLGGDKPFRAALAAWRAQPPSHDSAEAQAVAFQHLLERLSGKDLGWFFADWVLRDRALPDLSIADVETSKTPAGPGHNTGFLVAVTVRNDGAAVAEVPLTVRSGQFITTQRVRIAGFGQITQRVLVESSPTEVQVNDGSVPELRSVVHKRSF